MVQEDEMFFNREYELSRLKSLFNLNKASIVVCMGRRRIGKSTLIDEFAKDVTHYIDIQGLSPKYIDQDGQITKSRILLNDQLSNFDELLSQKANIPRMKPVTWTQAFSFLNSAIQNEPTVVLLDEISWMSSGEKNFAGALKIAWDTQLKRHPRLVLVLCGSVSSWIEDNILKNTGFRGRVSLVLKIEELSLHHSNQFWDKAPGKISSFEKFKILSVTGGVPKYLEEIDKNKSAEKNILHLCFQKEGYLFREYEEIFLDTFGKRSPTYQKIIEKLADGHQLIKDIASYLGWKQGGTINHYLEDLEKSGFIESYTSKAPGKKETNKNIRFRLCDNYLRFYLKYIYPKKRAINSRHFEQIELDTLPGWDTIMGLQFENLVLNNYKLVCSILDIKLSSVMGVGPYFQKKTKSRPGYQIDLLIETKYTIYICEIKFRKFIDLKVIQEVQRKMTNLNCPKHLSVRPILIYVGELDKTIVDEDFFAHLIAFDQLLSANCSL